jgi:hypothetical protein
MSELGFFFFLRMAVAVSSACGGSVDVISGPEGILTSLTSAPEGSLRRLLVAGSLDVHSGNLLAEVHLLAGVGWLSRHDGVVNVRYA